MEKQMPWELDEEQLVNKLNILLSKINSYNTPQFVKPLVIDSSVFVETMIFLLMKENNILLDKNFHSSPIIFLREYNLVPQNISEELIKIQKIRNEFVHGICDEISLEEYEEFKTVMQIAASWLATNSFLFQKYPQYQTAVVEKNNNYVDKLLESQNMIIKSLKERNEYLENKLELLIANQNKIMGKLDEISVTVKSINDSMNDYQSLAGKLVDHSKSEEETEMILQLFSDECVSKIEDRIADVTTRGQYSDVCSSLKESLGEDNFNKLDEDSKSFLVSSRIMYRNLDSFIDNVDYSGVCLLITKALERVCKKRIYSDFISYCRRKYTISSFPTSLVNEDRNREIREEDFTLGTIPFLLLYKKERNYVDNDKTVLMAYCKDVLFINTDEKHILKKVEEIGKNIDTIRTNYRNPSAHINSITKIKARECLDYVLDVQKVLKNMLSEFKY